ncbi:MAG: Mov34/MPN/PAD-1 family protein [Acidobacteriaceae bacterium]|nr:Mov34/MPN/PAD-1 family protein [Acidobacteriaceae bacterium]
MIPVFCPQSVVDQTIVHLQAAGTAGKECLVLWLARRLDDRLDVVAAHRPEQQAWRDRFIVDAAEMASLMALLRRDRLMIAAQVHSHPKEAFHSFADDEGAFIRHQGALSFVIPYFARDSSLSTFLAEAALYELQEGNRWMLVPREGVRARCQIRP